MIYCFQALNLPPPLLVSPKSSHRSEAGIYINAATFCATHDLLMIKIIFLLKGFRLPLSGRNRL